MKRNRTPSSYAAVTCVLVGAALGSVVDQRPASASDVTRQDIDAVVPRLEALIVDAMAKTGVPGVAVAVVQGSDVVYLEGFGVRETGRSDPVGPDTVFQIASLSKPFASTAIAAVVGDTDLTWDSRIADLDPAFRLKDPWVTSQITLRDLLSHRSGMPDHAGDMLEDLGYSREEILYRLRFMDLASSLRSEYAYTNFVFTEAGEAAAKALGTTWEDLIAERLFRPLGMDHTSARHDDYLAAEDHAVLHFMEDGEPVARFDRNPDAQSPAGGVSSSARDLAKWLTLQLNGGVFAGEQVVAEEALAETHRPQIRSGVSHDGRATFYGLGWGVDYRADGQVVLSHSGAFFLGARSFVMMLPDKDVGIVVVANAFPTGLPEAIGRGFFDLLLEGELTQDWLTIFEGVFAAMLVNDNDLDLSQPPATTTQALPAGAYVGRYANDLWGDAEVVETTDGLAVLLGPDRRAYPLSHWNRDVFSFQLAALGDDGNRTGRVTFSSVDGDRASALTIDLLDEGGQGTFVRTRDGE